MEEKKCFASNMTPIGWRCAALNTSVCLYPECKTFKTRDQIIKQKKRCKERLESLPSEARDYIYLKYGVYDTEEKSRGDKNGEEKGL